MRTLALVVPVGVLALGGCSGSNAAADPESDSETTAANTGTGEGTSTTDGTSTSEGETDSGTSETGETAEPCSIVELEPCSEGYYCSDGTCVELEQLPDCGSPPALSERNVAGGGRMIVGDLDVDGRADLVAVDGQTVSLSLGPIDAGFSLVHTWAGAAIRDAEIVDVSGGDSPDIVLGAFSSPAEKLRVLEGDGAGNVTEAWSGLYQSVLVMATGDITGASDPELVVGYGDGEGSVTGGLVVDAGVPFVLEMETFYADYVVQAFDVAPGPKWEIVVGPVCSDVCEGATPNIVSLIDGTYESVEAAVLSGGVHQLTAAQIDDDPELDMIGWSGRKDKQTQIQILGPESDGYATERIFGSVVDDPTYKRGMVAADLDGNGNPDLVVVTQSLIQVFWQLGQPDECFATYPSPGIAGSVVSGDIDGDTDHELLMSVDAVTYVLDVE